jgi:exopolysaccharide production protein ExoQ
VTPQTATVLFTVGIAGLFWLDRDGSARTSKALWLAVMWLLINGSRSVSGWFGMGVGMEIPGQIPPSSLLDQLVAGGLILSGAIVLTRPSRDVKGLLKASWPIVLFFSFALASIMWSDFPGWGFKRWVRALGDVVMALIVVTDPQPTVAIKRLLSRVGFVLLPASVLLIKYYPDLGRGFSDWGGDAIINTGVTTNKNSLGSLVFLIGLGTLWQVLSLLNDREQPHRARRILAQCTLLAFGVDLLYAAHSATSGAAFTLGAGVLLVITRPFFRDRPAAVHGLVLSVLMVGGITVLLGGKDDAVKAMGRNPDLTGRTEIWKTVIPLVPNSIVGAGFETFWIGPRVKNFYENYGGVHMTNEAHNGYVEAYLNLGWVGVGIVALILWQGYRKAVKAFRYDSGVGALLVACILALSAYNIGEAGFRMLNLTWFFLLLSILAASRVVSLGEAGSQLGQGIADTALMVNHNPCLRPQLDMDEALEARFGIQ